MTFIKFEEFLDAATNYNSSEQRAPLIVGLFNAAGSSYFDKRSNVAEATKFYYGNRKLTRDNVYPLKKENPINDLTIFFYGTLGEKSISSLIKHMGLKPFRYEKLPFSYALAKLFYSIFSTLDNDTSTPDDFLEWYKKAVAIPYCYMNDSKNEDYINYLCSEINGICPITKEKINPNDYRTFKIVHIYKKNIDDSYKNELKKRFNIEEPEFEDDYENCLMVSSKYEEGGYNLFEDTTIEKTIELYKAKRAILLKAKISSQLNENELSTKLKICISRIASSSLPKIENTTTIYYDPMAIEAKMGPEYYRDVYSAISSFYYLKIKNYFNQDLDLSTKELNNLLENVRKAYEDISKTTSDKLLIIEQLKFWFLRKLFDVSEYHAYEEQALIMVCYFIQDCEVFGHDIS